MAQPCSYIYPIYSVVKNRLRCNTVATLRPSGALETCSSLNTRFISWMNQTLKLEQVCSMSFVENGGADRDRTDDILLAKQALSQLSYSPIPTSIAKLMERKVVGLDRFELSTSPLSGVRSSQLSYRPGVAGDLRQLRLAALSPGLQSIWTPLGLELFSKVFEDTVERAK